MVPEEEHDGGHPEDCDEKEKGGDAELKRGRTPAKNNS